MELPGAKDDFLKIVKELNSEDKLPFLLWIAEEWNLQDLSSHRKPEAGDVVLKSIAAELRKKLPIEGVLTSEKIYEPSDISEENPSPRNSFTLYDSFDTSRSSNKARRSIFWRLIPKPILKCILGERERRIHIDEFLYDDSMVDKLVEQGKLSLQFCNKCGCSDIKSMEIITHSTSLNMLRYIFKALLPPLDGLTMLDIGSRFGSVLFGAYVFSTAKRIVGVEMNGELCKMAKDIVHRREMGDRVEVIQADITTQPNVISEANVVLINNMFEYFADPSTAVKCWKFIYQHLEPGTTLLISPPAPTTFKNYDLGFSWTDWLTELPLFDENPSGVVDLEDLRETLCAYTVTKNKPSVVFTDSPVTTS